MVSVNQVKDSCYYYEGVNGCAWLTTELDSKCGNPEKCSGKKPEGQYHVKDGVLREGHIEAYHKDLEGEYNRLYNAHGKEIKALCYLRNGQLGDGRVFHEDCYEKWESELYPTELVGKRPLRRKLITAKLYIGCINGVPTINRKTFYQYFTVDKPPAIGQTVDIRDAHNTLGKMIRVKILDVQGHPKNLKVLGEHMGVLPDIKPGRVTEEGLEHLCDGVEPKHDIHTQACPTPEKRDIRAPERYLKETKPKKSKRTERALVKATPVLPAGQTNLDMFDGRQKRLAEA